MTTAAVLVALTLLAVLLWPGPAASTWTPAGGVRAPADDRRGVVPVAEVLDLLALSLQGGAGVAAAVRATAAALPDGQAESLAVVAEALARGSEGEEAWAAAGPEWEPARRALALAAAAGVPPTRSLAERARDLRRDSTAAVEVASARLGVRLVLPLGLCFLPAFVLATVVPLVLALTRDLAW